MDKIKIEYEKLHVRLLERFPEVLERFKEEAKWHGDGLGTSAFIVFDFIKEGTKNFEAMHFYINEKLGKK